MDGQTDTRTERNKTVVVDDSEVMGDRIRRKLIWGRNKKKSVKEKGKEK